jgi:hypothetical protein
MKNEYIDKIQSTIRQIISFKIILVLIILFCFGFIPITSDAKWTIETIDSAAVGDTSIAIDSNDRVHISYDGWGELRYATNKEDAWFIETIDGIEPIRFANSIAIDSDNKIHISYYVGHYVRYATNKAGSWSIETIDRAEECSTSIAIDLLGKVHMSYCGLDGVKYATNKGGSWLLETVDDVRHTFYGTSIVIDSNDKAHISYFDRHEHGLRYATNKGGLWSIQTLDIARHDYYFLSYTTSIAIDSNNNVHISYSDLTNLKYATNKGGSWSIETIHRPIIHAGYTSITIDSNDRVHMSYSGWDSIWYCTNRGGSWSIEVVDSGTDVGHTSIAMDSKDNVHISYRDYDDLKYATNREVEIPVSIDIKPGSCPNPLNTKSQGVLPIAITGKKDFDVKSIDPESIRLSREGIDGAVAPIRWSYEDVSAPFEGDLCDCYELKADGIIDLSLKFKTQQLVDILKLKEVAGKTVEFTLRGNLKEGFDGTPMVGRDCIRILMQKVN